MTLRFEELEERHIAGASGLAHEAYLRERRHVPALMADGVPDLLRSAIAELVEHGHGIAAMDDGVLVGYLCLYGPFGGFFGKGTGCFSPLHGYAAAGGNRPRLLSLLFEHAAMPLATQGVDTFAITTWHHDADARLSLVENGFGARCTDAIRMIDPPIAAARAPGISYREVHWSDAGSLLPLHNGLVRHLGRAPTFVAAEELQPDAFAARLEHRKNRHFVAFHRETPIGYLELTDNGENVLTTSADMRNICGAFLAEDFRGHGVSRGLLGFMVATLGEEGVGRIGVDFETMNPTALGFWTKEFERYTTSFARRIDETD